MKKLIYFLSFFLFVSVLANAQSETRSLGSFDELSVCGSFKVNVKQGSSNSADIEMVKGDMKDLILEVKGNRLVIKFDNKRWGGGNNKANIELTVKNLSAVDVCAGASVSSENEFSADHFSAEASSGANLTFHVKADELNVDVSSGARITLKGSSNSQIVDASSGSNYYGTDMASEKVTVDVSSGASAKVWASKSLKAEASSGGSVKYKGDPSEKNLDPGKYSGGSIRPMK